MLASIMLASFLGAIEGTIVSTAMPAIAGDLGGFSLYSWVFSSYLLMVTVSVLIYGKLADLFGRKPVIVFGILLFMVGSLLCGFSDSMEMLILFRFVQGVGAGAIGPIATTIVGDLYKGKERGKVQGYLSSVWGISAVLGPVIGGIFVEQLSWHYIFWMNLPLGLLSLLGFIVFFHEEAVRKKGPVDYGGAILLFVSVTSLMIVLIQGGIFWDWLSVEVFGLTSIFLGGVALFVYRAFRLEGAMIPLFLWQQKSILIANLVSLFTGVILIGISAYLPTYVQGIMGRGPTIAGFTLTVMSIGWPIASTLAGKLVFSVGFRLVSLLGGLFLVAGSMFFLFLTPDRGPLWAAFGSFFTGIGMGLTSTAFIVSIQTTVSREQRGIATALNMFMRNMGNAIGAAFMGGILNMRLHSLLAGVVPPDKEHLTVDSINRLLERTEGGEWSEPVRSMMRGSLATSLHSVYIGVMMFAILSFFLILLYPKSKGE